MAMRPYTEEQLARLKQIALNMENEAWDARANYIRALNYNAKLIEDACDHNFSTYLGHGHNDEAYQCPKCKKVKYV